MLVLTTLGRVIEIILSDSRMARNGTKPSGAAAAMGEPSKKELSRIMDVLPAVTFAYYRTWPQQKGMC